MNESKIAKFSAVILLWLLTVTAHADSHHPSSRTTFFGQHGYDPGLPEMKAIFYAAGPDFKRETIKAVENIDVAPTVANLLGISPPEQAQGRKIHINGHGKP